MTDNDIIKALEACASSKICHSEHTKCSFFNEEDCITLLCQSAGVLIKRQKAEIERLQEQIEEYPFKCKVGNNSELHSKSIEYYDKVIGDISAEAVKGFAERLKEEQEYFANECDDFVGYVAVSRIDDLLKEMAGDNNAAD